MLAEGSGVQGNCKNGFKSVKISFGMGAVQMKFLQELTVRVKEIRNFLNIISIYLNFCSKLRYLMQCSLVPELLYICYTFDSHEGHLTKVPKAVTLNF